ncbi:Glycosyltransferase like family 2 [anaerobic digester metagenome]
MEPKVTIIILNWNGWKDTIECLESVQRINYQNYHVVVVDNASEDDSIEKIREYSRGKIDVKSNFFKYGAENKPVTIFELFKEDVTSQKPIPDEIVELPPNRVITLIKNDLNQGFADGNNIGIEYALKSLDSDYVLLLNNDTVVDPNFLEELVDFGEKNENAGFIGPKTYYYSNDNMIQMAGGGRINLKTGEPYGIDLEEVDNGQHNENRELDYISGSCILCKRAVLEEVGLMDPKHFMYWEETDWCFRGRKAGYKSFYVFKSQIWHKVGKSSQTELKIYYHNRNRLYFMRKNADKRNMFIFLLYFFLFYFWFMSGVYLIYRHDRNKFMSFLRGTREGFKVKPDIEL